MAINSRRTIKKIEALKLLGMDSTCKLEIDDIYSLVFKRGYIWNEKTLKWVSENDVENKLHPISIRVEYSLYSALKQKAKDKDISLAELVESSLKMSLSYSEDREDISQIKELLYQVLEYLTR